VPSVDAQAIDWGMRLRLAEILKENKRKGVEPSTADQLAKKSKGRLSMSTAVRLARDEWKVLPRDVLITLCEVLQVGPNELLDYTPTKRKRGRS
jgi:DNA-binding Xre family transcriptional regulator